MRPTGWPTGWLLITYVLPKIEAWETSMLLVMQPAGTILWAYLILGEVFSISQSVGLCLVVLGVTVVTVSRALASNGDSPRPGQLRQSPPTLQQE